MFVTRFSRAENLEQNGTAAEWHCRQYRFSARLAPQGRAGMRASKPPPSRANRELGPGSDGERQQGGHALGGIRPGRTWSCRQCGRARGAHRDHASPHTRPGLRLWLPALRQRGAQRRGRTPRAMRMSPLPPRISTILDVDTSAASNLDHPAC